jgi:hypothetical protein
MRRVGSGEPALGDIQTASALVVKQTYRCMTDAL